MGEPILLPAEEPEVVPVQENIALPVQVAIQKCQRPTQRGGKNGSAIYFAIMVFWYMNHNKGLE